MYVHAMGLACPVGLLWLPACAAMRAGIHRKVELHYRHDDGEPIIGSASSRLEGSRSARARWLRLLSWSLVEALQATSIADRGRLAVILALPGARETSVADPHHAGVLLRELDRECGIELGLDPRRVAIVRSGASGAMHALALAQRELEGGEPCLVAAADSLIGAEALLDLRARKRLLAEDNPDGVIPGEAAACLLIARERVGALAHVRALGFGHERALPENDIPMRAEGIVEATRAALASCGLMLHELDFRVSDAAGDQLAFKEQALLVTRMLRQPKNAFPLVLPAHALGDTGAAAGLCGMVMAVESILRRKGAGPRAIVFAGNQWGDRAAAIVEQI